MAGLIAAAATALVSPSFLFVPELRIDSPWRMPYRLNVLVRYGEGPHMTALAWIPLALLFSYRAFQQWRPVSLALASVCCAMVVSNNFYGATSLAMLFPITGVGCVHHAPRSSGSGSERPRSRALAYGLTAFWLVPSYLQITLANMRFVSSEGNLWSAWVFLAVVIAILSVLPLFRPRPNRSHLSGIRLRGRRDLRHQCSRTSVS